MAGATSTSVLRRARVADHVLLQAGLLCFSLGIALSVRAHLGLSPWDVFHQGLSRHLPVTIGEASQLAGLAVVALCWAVGMRPGFGTLCNMVLIGFWLDRLLATGWIPDLPDGHVVERLLMVAACVALFGVGSGAYIGARMGAGPRDSLMLVITRRTGLPVAAVRGGIEGSACVTGFLLGGSVGVGTLATALLIGPAVQLGLRLFRVAVHDAPARSRRRLREPAAAGT